MNKEEKDFEVQCAVCGQIYTNWVGSTPCCGSIAYVIGDDGKPTETIVLYGKISDDE
jgi:hypothetical protein